MSRAANYAQKSAQHVWSVPVQAIFPNPHQPRRSFDDATIEALAASIRQVGLLQPIAVRAVGIARYELIAGERRLRACRQLGLTHIDALVLSATEAHGALLALVENLQREDLHYLDEAEGYAKALHGCQMTQQALAARLGLSQSAIANKLRLLRLSPAVRGTLRASDLTERHARALLRLPDTARQTEAVQKMTEQKLTVRQGEALVSDLLNAVPAARTRRPAFRVLTLVRDHRLYVNAIRDIIRQMQAAGLDAQADYQDRDGDIEITVRVPKNFSNRKPEFAARDFAATD